MTDPMPVERRQIACVACGRVRHISRLVPCRTGLRCAARAACRTARKRNRAKTTHPTTTGASDV